MKSFAVSTLVIGLVSAISGAVVSEEQTRGINGRDGSDENGSYNGLPEDRFYGKACASSSIDGPSNPQCHGEGNDTTTGDVDYNFTYGATPGGGSLNIVIEIENDRTCTYNTQAEGKVIKDVVKTAAENCVKSRTV